MATYRDIASTEVDPDSPVTATLMQALAENPLGLAQMDATAITAGEVNAAQFYQHALVTGSGDTDALIYDQAVDGTVSLVEFNLGSDKLSGFEYQLVLEGISHNNGASQSTQLRFFRETSASYTSWLNCGRIGANSQFMFGDMRFRILPTGDVIIGTTALTISVLPSSESGHTVWDMGSVQDVTTVQFRWAAGSIDAGKIYAYKRATYTGRE